jgi:predicted GH43/DUF377 family glycosyl hydrolase
MRIISRVLALPEESVRRLLKNINDEFSDRHIDLHMIFIRHFEKVRSYMMTDMEPSWEKKQLIGAMFTNEYALECAALFNPSIVAHPDQSGLPKGSLRFIMSLRAIGEGHISSISFRMGVVDKNSSISMENPTRFVFTPENIENAYYDRTLFRQKLNEMGFLSEIADKMLDSLEPAFTFDQLTITLNNPSINKSGSAKMDQITKETILWLAQSNYEIQFSPEQKLSQRIIFPTSPSEQNGIEDARFVRFTNDDNTIIYYATYTAYDGKTVLPQLIQTEDFLHFKVITLNGKAVENKGMALFPRKLNGKYVMISRQDNENLYLMHSDNIHFWHEMHPLLKPTFPWEFMQVGNCGTPIETEYGWLVITHGVGPMRKYSIGAILLDMENPQKVIGRLAEPLLVPNENEREGYVPNVVYTCGALVHNEYLILPYAMADYATSIAIIELQPLLDTLLKT